MFFFFLLFFFFFLLFFLWWWSGLGCRHVHSCHVLRDFCPVMSFFHLQGTQMTCSFVEPYFSEPVKHSAEDVTFGHVWHIRMTSFKILDRMFSVKFMRVYHRCEKVRVFHRPEVRVFHRREEFARIFHLGVVWQIRSTVKFQQFFHRCVKSVTGP